MIRSNLSLAALAGALLFAGAAHAQGVLVPGAMPPPPSFRDSTKSVEDGSQKRRARKPAAQAEGAVSGDEQPAPRRKLRATTAAPSAPGGGYSGRVDDRPQPTRSQGMQLEDDPRSVTPIMNNGRAGVGMRF